MNPSPPSWVHSNPYPSPFTVLGHMSTCLWRQQKKGCKWPGYNQSILLHARSNKNSKLTLLCCSIILRSQRTQINHAWRRNSKMGLLRTIRWRKLVRQFRHRTSTISNQHKIKWSKLQYKTYTAHIHNHQNKVHDLVIRISPLPLTLSTKISS